MELREDVFVRTDPDNGNAKTDPKKVQGVFIQ